MRRMSLRALAAGQFSFQRRPFVRMGMMAVPPRSRIAVWQRRVMFAGLGVTLIGVWLTSRNEPLT